MLGLLYCISIVIIECPVVPEIQIGSLTKFHNSLIYRYSGTLTYKTEVVFWTQDSFLFIPSLFLCCSLK